MPIAPFLSGQVFDPDAIQAMSYAFSQACERIGLADRTDPATELVAEKVICLMQSGVSNPADLLKRTLEEFDVRD